MTLTAVNWSIRVHWKFLHKLSSTTTRARPVCNQCACNDMCTIILRVESVGVEAQSRQVSRKSISGQCSPAYTIYVCSVICKNLDIHTSILVTSGRTIYGNSVYWNMLTLIIWGNYKNFILNILKLWVWVMFMTRLSKFAVYCVCNFSKIVPFSRYKGLGRGPWPLIFIRIFTNS